jgi:hypothetical protein
MNPSALAETCTLPTNPLVIHKFNTFLGMTALGISSEVSYLSRGRRGKDGSIEWGKRSRDQPHKTRAKRKAESRDSESSPEIRCDHRQRALGEYLAVAHDPALSAAACTTATIIRESVTLGMVKRPKR